MKRILCYVEKNDVGIGWKQLVGKLARMDKVIREKNLCYVEKNDVGRRNWDGSNWLQRRESCWWNRDWERSGKAKAVGNEATKLPLPSSAGRESFEKEEAQLKTELSLDLRGIRSGSDGKAR